MMNLLNMLYEETPEQWGGSWTNSSWGDSWTMRSLLNNENSHKILHEETPEQWAWKFFMRRLLTMRSLLKIFHERTSEQWKVMGSCLYCTLPLCRCFCSSSSKNLSNICFSEHQLELVAQHILLWSDGALEVLVHSTFGLLDKPQGSSWGDSWTMKSLLIHKETPDTE